MTLSTFDLYTIGIGPSSSHTVGPMKAAKTFVDGLIADGLLDATVRVRVELFGSLGATGPGHGSERAVLLGLEGEEPATVETATAESRLREAKASRKIHLAGRRAIDFHADDDLVLHRRRSLPLHPNGMSFTAHGLEGAFRERTYYSVGGGVRRRGRCGAGRPDRGDHDGRPVPIHDSGGAA